MRIEHISLEKKKEYTFPVVACIGYFDGLHRGHQSLIEKTIELSKKYACETALITFEPDPVEVIRGTTNTKHITPMHQRVNLIVRFGIENIFILDFSKEMCELPPEEFIKQVLNRINLKALVCGFDFHYGYKGEGNPETLKQSCPFEVVMMNEVIDNDKKVSSTRIIKCIQEGNVKEAERLLGYPYEIIGTVSHGKHQGSTKLGFPTANVKFSSEFIIPKPGVYACYAIVKGKQYKAMANFGHNPTFNYTDELSLEAHVIDYDGDLYGKRIRILFKDFIREEKKFKSIGNLILQLEQDAITVKKILNDEE